MKTNHSKLPWKKGFIGDEMGNHSFSIEIDNNLTHSYHVGIADNEADAEFIIRAANNFYPLLEACKLGLGNMDCIKDGDCEIGRHCLGCDGPKIEEVIKAAEKED